MANCKGRFVFDPMVLIVLLGCGTDADMIADRVQCDRGAVYRWLNGSAMWDAYKADRYAIRAGYHPAVVWGQQWWDECEWAAGAVARRAATRAAKRLERARG